MKKIIRSIIEFGLAFVGFKLAREFQYVTNRTSSQELKVLIQKLKPVSINTRLIRFGPNGDGGYLVPDDLDGITSCFSPGVGALSGFELDCAKNGMTVFLADKSIESPSENHELFNFESKYIGAYRNEDFLTIDDWVTESPIPPEQDSILQMDIEGYEYEAILNLSARTQSRFRIIIVEFHSLDELWNKPFFKLSSRVFEKILHTHECVHIHPNNYSPAVEYDGISIPPMLEITFLRKDRVVKNDKELSFPNNLDFENTDHPSLKLPEIWYK